LLYKRRDAKVVKTFTKFSYGVGEYCKLLIQWLLDMGIETYYFGQTDEAKNREINGVTVISFENLVEIDRSFIFVTYLDSS